VFRAEADELFGVLHRPEKPNEVGIVVLVGGPQYRVGSHRMFVQIARALASDGYAVLRFDFAGMGDSEGDFPGFERVDRDVRAAIDHMDRGGHGLRRFVLIGLCDGASAAAYYAASDPRVAALVLLNPWVHTEAARAKAYLWHYYPRRLLQVEFWRSVLRGRVAVRASFGDFATEVGRSVRRSSPVHFVDRMRLALARFGGQTLVIASENDLTAAEFLDLCNRDRRWRDVVKSAELTVLDGADHTLSSDDAMRRFCARVGVWLRTKVAGAAAVG
jgi:exosortase A-associated hydrolase 1